MGADLAPRIYLATPDVFEPEDLAPRLAALLAPGSVACVRLALAESADEDAWTRAINHLLPICHDADVPMVVTDHYRLADRLGLDGVHLANGRTLVRDVRQVLGKDRIVGAYAGSSRHEGMVLAEAGADYVSFGPVGATGALGDETRAEDDLFAWWAEMIETPVVAEGSVSPGDAERLAATADFIVPGPDLWDAAMGGLPLLADYAKLLAVTTLVED